MHSKSENDKKASKDNKKDGVIEIDTTINRMGGYNVPATDKKILFYTKFEGNTVGDERFLEIIHGAVISGLAKDAEIGIFLAYDEKSKDRARNAVMKLLTTMTGMGFDANKIKFWLHQAPVEKPKSLNKPEQGTALLTKCMPTVSTHIPAANDATAAIVNKEKIVDFIAPNRSPVKKSKKSNLDLFIVAGWAHQLNSNGADHFDNTLKVPKATKILLCAPPGGYIDRRNIGRGIQNESMKNALIRRDYHNVYCLQPGVHLAGGLFISPSTTLNAVQQDQTRTAWLTHLSAAGLQKQLAPKLKEVGNKAKDELVVIYCSKDSPGRRGQEFIEQIAQVHKKNYPVLLVGTKEGSIISENYKKWATLCGENGLTSYPLPRTTKTEILMRGLHDAEYLMATGSFSILEAKKLGLHNCAYLAPPTYSTFLIFLRKLVQLH